MAEYRRDFDSGEQLSFSAAVERLRRMPNAVFPAPAFAATTLGYLQWDCFGSSGLPFHVPGPAPTGPIDLGFL